MARKAQKLARPEGFRESNRQSVTPQRWHQGGCRMPEKIFAESLDTVSQRTYIHPPGAVTPASPVTPASLITHPQLHNKKHHPNQTAFTTMMSIECSKSIETKSSQNSRSVGLLCMIFCLLVPQTINAATYEVSASGGDGTLTLSEAMALAEAGDTVLLEDGTYDEALETVRDGERDNPIVVEGGPNAILNGVKSPSVFVTHSFVELKGFAVDGKTGPADEEESYVNKCVLVMGTGTDSSSPLDGFVMEGLTIQNCGGECVRLMNFVENANIESNTISDCGIYDYRFGAGSKNGEGIYIGTACAQWTNGEDQTNNNVVSGNTISTNANECVDIKEGATGNIVEYNSCTNQLDENSGCYDSRGDDNIFRYNTGSNCLGAGVRLGGHEVDNHQYGAGNSVYGNEFASVGQGGVKVQVAEQGDVCGNACEGGSSCDLTGLDQSVKAEFEDVWDHDCS